MLRPPFGLPPKEEAAAAFSPRVRADMIIALARGLSLFRRVLRCPLELDDVSTDRCPLEAK